MREAVEERAGAGGLPGLMIAVLAVGSGVVEPFCARLRHRQLPFGALDSESDPSDEPIKTLDDRLRRMQTIIQRKQGVLSESDNYGFFPSSKNGRRRRLWPHRGVARRRPTLTLGERG